MSWPSDRPWAKCLLVSVIHLLHCTLHTLSPSYTGNIVIPFTCPTYCWKVNHQPRAAWCRLFEDRVRFYTFTSSTEPFYCLNSRNIASSKKITKLGESLTRDWIRATSMLSPLDAELSLCSRVYVSFVDIENDFCRPQHQPTEYFLFHSTAFGCASLSILL